MYLNGLNTGGKIRVCTVEVAQEFVFNLLVFLISRIWDIFLGCWKQQQPLVFCIFIEFEFYFILENKPEPKRANRFSLKKENRYFYMQQREECPFSFCKNKSCAAHSSRRVGGQLKFSNTELLIVRKCFYLGENWFWFGSSRGLCLNK